jgi:hypothetical protein
MRFGLVLGFLVFFKSLTVYSHVAGIAAGSPAPSFAGVFYRYEFSNQVTIGISSGYSTYPQINVLSFAPTVRFYLSDSLETPLRLWALGGLNVLSISGNGTLQNLDASSDTLLPLLQLGIGADFQPSDQVIIGLGVQFHFPVKLIFPLFEIGYRFH